MVDGHELMWWTWRTGVRHCPDCDHLRVMLMSASRTGAVVHVPHGLRDNGPDVPITPRFVAAAARQALLAGWRPGESTGAFHLPGPERQDGP